MADTILTHDMVADRVLFDKLNQLTLSRHVFTGYREEFHAQGRFQKGDTVRVHLPNQYRTQSGPDITGSIPDQQENSANITVDVHDVVPLDFTAQQLTLDIEDLSRKYLQKAANALANKVDYNGCSEFVNIYNSVGTPGTVPATFAALADGAQRMDEESVPRDRRVGVLGPVAHWAMADGELKSVFQQNIVDTMVRRGFIGRFALMDFFMDQNIKNHTTGTEATRADGTSTVQVASAPAEGATAVALKGLTASTGTITAGDVLTFATVGGVNTESGDAWGSAALRQFVCTATATADASGLATVSVSPKIISSAASTKLLPYQTVDDLPATNDNVTITGSASTAYPQNMLFEPDCFALTMVPFMRPDSAGQSVKWGSASDERLGLSITFSSGFAIQTFIEYYRLDTLYGWDTPRPELGVRLWG
jgi:hypothetical protein